MSTINDVIYKSTMFAMNQGCQAEQKRIWQLIKMDPEIPATVKMKAKEIIFGAKLEKRSGEDTDD